MIDQKEVEYRKRIVNSICDLPFIRKEELPKDTFTYVYTHAYRLGKTDYYLLVHLPIKERTPLWAKRTKRNDDTCFHRFLTGQRFLEMLKCLPKNYSSQLLFYLDEIPKWVI